MKTIKELHHSDKPREKLKEKGAKALKNDELLAVLLGSGIVGKDVRKLSKEIVQLLDRDFDHLSLKQLCTIHGLGEAKASQILASVELSRRYLIQGNRRISSAEEVYGELRNYAAKKQEYFLTVTLDGASHIINVRTVFIGTLNQSMVHPREVFADAIEDRAAGIIIAHNHPSGDPSPSKEDIALTNRLTDVLEVIDVRVLDHLVIGGEIVSFADYGLLRDR
jgi:DNA repair protein RadC